MRKIYWMFGLLAICYSCSEVDDLLIVSSDQSLLRLTTRAAGDEKYDVLGYGYDVTGEYLHPLSVKNPVLDIKKYERDYLNRIIEGTSSFGFDQMYYGYSASDYTKDITTETNVDSNISYGDEKVDTVPYFSGNIKNNNYLKTEYAYSDKYSFASVDAVRNRKYIRINDEVSRLSQYLSDEFIEDLDRLSPDRIVERYGTHVLTDFIIGGRYKLMFRSIIIHTKDASHKKKTVASGLKAALFGIGFSLNISRTVQTDESLVKDNHNKELFVLFYGGNGTSVKYDLEKGMPTGVDIQNWENTVNLSNSCLNEIKWEETYPIYDFISDPIKKESIKMAVMKHIKNSKLNELKLKLLYAYDCRGGRKHFVTTDDGIAVRYPDWKFWNYDGFILAEQLPGTIPLYEYATNATTLDFFTTTIPNYDLMNPLYEKRLVLGYVYEKRVESTVPLYEYYHTEHDDHLTTLDPNIIYNFGGWIRIEPPIVGYIYPTN